MKNDVGPRRLSKPQWFGSAVTVATEASAAIPLEPFPVLLLTAMEPHIDKARKSRQQALDAIKKATRAPVYKKIMNRYLNTPLSKEGRLSFDPQKYPLREALLETCGLPPTTNLARLHTGGDGVPSKVHLLKHLTERPQKLQTVYDEFVRQVCCPRVSELWDDGGQEEENSIYYYQCFPCLRMVQPGDFSIGPHADVVYGHHPLSTNFYVLLTDLAPPQSSAALFLESTPGAEDWHPILGNYGGEKGGGVTHFPGGRCMHWTAENNTSMTRVSLDFRIIPGSLYNAMVDGGGEEDGKIDVFRKTEGYYSQCRRKGSKGQWERIGPLLAPDTRVGFPWTVSNWEKLMEQKQKH